MLCRVAVLLIAVACASAQNSVYISHYFSTNAADNT